MRSSASSSRSSIWLILGLTSMGGSSNPVGRTTLFPVATAGLFQFIIAGGTHINGLTCQLLETHQSSAVCCPKQMESESNPQVGLAGTVAAIHGSDLGTVTWLSSMTSRKSSGNHRSGRTGGYRVFCGRKTWNSFRFRNSNPVPSFLYQS